MSGWLANGERNRKLASRTGEPSQGRFEGAAGRRPGACLGRIVLAAAWMLALEGVGVSQRQAQPEEAGGDPSAAAAAAARLRSSAPKPGEVVPPPSGMTFTTHLDHTAVWVGDQFHYTIIVDHAPAYEFVLETLTKETVNMDPFQVMDVTKETMNLKAGDRRLYLDLTMTSFATGKATEQIPQLTLFYFKREPGVLRAEEAAAESLTVPGPVLGMRSTLPPNVNDIRDPTTISSWPQSRWLVAGAGAFSLILLVTGLGWETVALVRRRRSQRGPDRRKAMNAVRERWLRAVPGDFANTEATVRFYDQSYQDLKEYVGYYLETPAAGLTADELQEEMQRLGADREFQDKVVRVLETLEADRYSQNGHAPAPEAVQRTAQEIREIFSAGSRR